MTVSFFWNQTESGKKAYLTGNINAFLLRKNAFLLKFWAISRPAESEKAAVE